MREQLAPNELSESSCLRSELFLFAGYVLVFVHPVNECYSACSVSVCVTARAQSACECKFSNADGARENRALENSHALRVST